MSRECPRCLSAVAEDAERCPACGAQLTVRPIPFFPGAATWRAADAPPETHDVPDGPPPTLEQHFDDPHLFETEAPVPPLPPEETPTQPLETFSIPAKEPAPSFGESLSEPLFNVRALKEEIEGPPDDSEAKPSPPSPATSTQRPFTVAPLWRRSCATVVDALPIAGAAMLCLLAFDKRLEAGNAPLVPHSLDDLSRMYWSLGVGNLVLAIVVLLAVLAYQTFCLGFMHATVGDLIFGMRWVTRDGSPPKPIRAFVRVLLLVPSWLLAGAGVWIFLLTRTRRALYDIASGCYLVLRD